MRETDETFAASRKQKVTKAMVVFIGVMAALAFLSNTINHLSLPRVRTEWPSRGSIVREIKMDGKIVAKKNFEFFIPSAMQVLEVKIHTGDQVKKGQTLLRLDTSGIQKQLLDETDRYEQKKINLELLKLKSGSDLASYDEAIEQAQIQLERAKVDYERIQVLVEQGSETGENLKNASRKLDDAQRALEKAIGDRGDALLSGQAEAQKNEMETQGLLYDMEIQKRQIDQLQKQLKACDVTAPFSGIISAVNCREGETAGQSQPLYSLMDISKGYCLKGLMDKDLTDELKPGDEAEIVLDGHEWQPIQGKVIEFRNSSNSPGEEMEVELEIASEGWSEGQKGSARFEKRSAVYEHLVSNSAIGRDNNGYFVYIPEEKKGYLGNEIYARMVRVTIGESDDKKTAVVQGLDRDDRVIGNSDKPLTDNMRVIWEQ
ncbi:MAG: HlyD family efflux transporter periplasmic adaptor subunit [Ruminiclostridium sp.]|nr:HlyD family efflux transporter periplasmic adaptor subunit [Ruminiclostridium sp.]